MQNCSTQTTVSTDKRIQQQHRKFICWCFFVVSIYRRRLIHSFIVVFYCAVCSCVGPFLVTLSIMRFNSLACVWTWSSILRLKHNSILVFDCFIPRGIVAFVSVVLMRLFLFIVLIFIFVSYFFPFHPSIFVQWCNIFVCCSTPYFISPL